MGTRLPMGFSPKKYNPWDVPGATQPMEFMPPAQPAFSPPQMAMPPAPPTAAMPPGMNGATARDIISRHLGLTPVAAGSGLKDTAEYTDSDKYNAQSHQNTWADRDQMLANASNVEAIPAVAQQRQAQEQNRALFELELNQPRTPDLAGPLSLAAHNIDPRYGVGPAAKPEMGVKEIREWAKQLQDDQHDLAKTIIAGTNSAKSGSLSDQISQMLGIKAIQSAQDPTLNQRAPNGHSDWLRWTNAVEKTMKTDQEALSEAHQLKAAIHGDPTAQRGVPIMLGKMLTGSSRVPIQEVMMEKGDPSFVATMMQKWNTLAKGEITDANKKQYSDFIDELMQMHERGINNHVQAGLARGRPLGLNEGQMKSWMAPQFVMPHTPPKTAPTAPKIDINKMIMDELNKGDK